MSGAFGTTCVRHMSVLTPPCEMAALCFCSNGRMVDIDIQIPVVMLSSPLESDGGKPAAAATGLIFISGGFLLL